MTWLAASADIDGQFRWSLHRRWKSANRGKTVTWICLNPSTADGLKDDPSLRAMVHFSSDNGYAALDLGNVFPFMSPHPKILKEWLCKPLSGEVLADNLVRIRNLCQNRDVVFGFGIHAHKLDPLQTWRVYQAARSSARKIMCITTTAAGWPVHPLWSKAQDFEPWHYPTRFIPEGEK